MYVFTYISIQEHTKEANDKKCQCKARRVEPAGAQGRGDSQAAHWEALASLEIMHTPQVHLPPAMRSGAFIPAAAQLKLP